MHRAQGFIVSDFESKYGEEFYATVPKMLASGELKVKEDIYKGLDKLPQAFLDMLSGTVSCRLSVCGAGETWRF